MCRSIAEIVEQVFLFVGRKFGDIAVYVHFPDERRVAVAVRERNRSAVNAALDIDEAAGTHALNRRCLALVVSAVFPILKVAGVFRSLEQLLNTLLQALKVSFAAKLREQPSARLENAEEVFEECLMIRNPVKDGVAENAVARVRSH